MVNDVWQVNIWIHLGKTIDFDIRFIVIGDTVLKIYFTQILIYKTYFYYLVEIIYSRIIVTGSDLN
jgi:hypothetical protein